MHVVVTGAGLVGSLLAIYLRDLGYDVSVYEKRADIRKDAPDVHRSINLVLTSRGLYALRQVGLDETALKLAVPVEGRALHQKDGSSGFQPYGVSSSEVNYSISRTKINALLIDHAERRGAKIHFEHDLHSHDLFSNTLVFCDMRLKLVVTAKADAVFGTDGAGSPTRRCLYDFLRGTGVHAATDVIERLGVSYKELTFPASAADKTKYAMNHRALHIWPRGPHFLMGLADLEPTFTGTLYLPDGSATLAGEDPSVPTFEHLGKDRARWAAYVKQHYPDVPSLVPNYLDQLVNHGHSFLATLRTTHWTDGNGKVILLGDAGHALVPFFGQGMNLGFESVVVLDRFLKTHGGNFKAAFADYTAYHKEAATAMQDMAIENFTEMALHVSQPAFLARKAVENAVEARLPTKFRSRYYMVTKTLIPYDLVQQCGPLVEKTIDAVQVAMKRGGAASVDALTDAQLTIIVDQHLTTFLAHRGIVVGDPLMEYYPGPKKLGKAKL